MADFCRRVREETILTIAQVRSQDQIIMTLLERTPGDVHETRPAGFPRARKSIGDSGGRSIPASPDNLPRAAGLEPAQEQPMKSRLPAPRLRREQDSRNVPHDGQEYSLGPVDTSGRNPAPPFGRTESPVPGRALFFSAV